MTGFVDPVFVTHAGDGSRRLFIVEQRGVIKISKRGRVLPTPFLDLRSRVLSGGERGLLGLAFHPAHARNRKFYLFFTERGTGDLIIAEMRAKARNRDRARSGSFRRLLRIFHRRHSNHNGGMLAFGKDRMLYIATGDGGGGGDPDDNAQSRTSRLGKLLRIDVDGRSGGLAYRIPPTNPHATSTTFQREIWSLGLRNPFRFSFDRRTGDLWIGDVGQNRFEEVNRATEASGGGRAVDFGWRLLEGRACFQPPSGCNRAGKQAPLTIYDHSEGCAVIGGYVYRGPIERLRGAYLFSDACSGEVWSVVAEGAARQRKVLMAETDLPISSFGESETGVLFVTALDGNVYRLTATER
ncbi:MAG: PQQ-dependent sugar dehydrogenase [Gammaproteobacteria bacterium]